ncbi:G1/S-specific cyclin-D1-like [Arapaima gigas]
MSGWVWSEEAGEGARGARVLDRLLRLQEKYLPSAPYVALVQKEPETRDALLKWALEVCWEQGCVASVFPLAVSLLDRCLSTSTSLPVSPACLAAACILIASKLAGGRVVDPDALSAAAAASFLPGHLRDMESVVLATLRWDVAAVTPHDFLPHFLALLPDEGDGFLSAVRRLGDSLVALCVSDARLLGVPPAAVAAAALSSAWRALGGTDPIGSTLARLCGVEKAALQYCCELMEGVTAECLGIWEKQAWHPDGESPGDEVTDDRASTPTDLRQIRF